MATFNYYQKPGQTDSVIACEGKKFPNSIFSVQFTLNKKINGPYKISSKTRYYIDAGTDHIVNYVPTKKDLNETDVAGIGKIMRFHKQFQPNGTNVNFVFCESPNKFYLRTFERGVEAETLACGTGSMAAVIGRMNLGQKKKLFCKVIQSSKEVLSIKCRMPSQNKIILEQKGRAKLIFTGTYEL